MINELFELKKYLSDLDQMIWMLSNVVQDMIENELHEKESKLFKQLEHKKLNTNV